MAESEVLYEVRDAVALVTLNRPDKLNAWTLTMEAEYRQALAGAALDRGVRAIVVTGAGRGFCAGADLSLLQSVVKQELDTESMRGEFDLPGVTESARADFRKQYSFPPAVHKPILAAINGPAVGLGLVHALYCDIRFASDQARFGTAFAQRGLIAEHGLAWLLPRIVGMENAMDMLFSGRLLSAEEAHHMGLIGHVVPHDELLDKVLEYAQLLATQSSPRSLAVMKRQLWDGQFMGLGEAIDDAVEEMLASFHSADFKEGVQCFLEKRPPRFTGE